MAVSHCAAQHVTTRDSGCCQCESQRLLPSVSLGLTERLHQPHHHVNRPAKLNGWRAVKPTFNFCLKAISVSGLLWRCGCWKLPWCQLEHLTQSCDFCWTQAPPWGEWFLIFVRKFSNSLTHSPPSGGVICSLLHLRMWVRVCCLRCSFFYVFFPARGQNRSKRKNKKSWETQGLIMWSLSVQTGFC